MRGEVLWCEVDAKWLAAAVVHRAEKENEDEMVGGDNSAAKWL